LNGFRAVHSPIGWVRVVGDYRSHTRVSHKSDKNGSSINELDG
jgi:hypothetical protein